MISKFKQNTSLTMVFAILLSVLIGCSPLKNSVSIDDTAKDNNIVTPDASILPVQPKENTLLEKEANDLIDDESCAEVLPDDLTEEEKVEFYLGKLKDKSFTGTYGEGYTWFTAAEELGMIGKPAIPGLIEKLETEDDYERALALYALLLTTQHDNVNTFTNGEHIDVNLDFDSNNHPEMVDKAKAWWDKYKQNF